MSDMPRTLPTETYHLAIDGSSDLDTPVLESWGRRSAGPSVIFTDGACLWLKVGKSSPVELGLFEGSSLQELGALQAYSATVLVTLRRLLVYADPPASW
jgi:hypothetical protein